MQTGPQWTINHCGWQSRLLARVVSSNVCRHCWNFRRWRIIQATGMSRGMACSASRCSCRHVGAKHADYGLAYTSSHVPPVVPAHRFQTLEAPVGAASGKVEIRKVDSLRSQYSGRGPPRLTKPQWHWSEQCKAWCMMTRGLERGASADQRAGCMTLSDSCCLANKSRHVHA